ncbi:MAG: RNA polymerase sigma factor [Chromatiales bacterium]|nr:MAG: RNA polymerase sigma factor [Chromatiales bacterium]
MTESTELVQRMLAGDERAFTAFFNDYFPRVYRFALPRLNSDADAAAEVVQAALTKAMRKLKDFRGEASLFTWVCQICRHEVVDHLRREGRHASKVVLIDDSADVRAAVEAIAGPEIEEPAQQYSQAEVRKLVRTVLDRLPPRYGDALEMKYVEGLSVDEIAVELGIGTTATQSLLARARVAFRDSVEAVFGAASQDVLLSLR